VTGREENEFECGGLPGGPTHSGEVHVLWSKICFVKFDNKGRPTRVLTLSLWWESTWEEVGGKWVYGLWCVDGPPKNSRQSKGRIDTHGVNEWDLSSDTTNT
jgi:hypothetical protein